MSGGGGRAAGSGLGAGAGSAAGRRALRVSAALLVVLTGVALTGCAGDGARDSAAAAEWVEFGGFERPADTADAPLLTGPAQIRVPDAGVVELNAADFLPGEAVTHEQYTTSYNENVPMIIGVVESWAPASGREPEGRATTVLGIAVTGGEAQLRTKTRAYLGEPHTIEVAGSSDLGVVAIAVEGALDMGDPTVIRRTVGVDAARGTHVWSKDGGYPVYGVDTAELFFAPARDACAERVERYHVGSGRVLELEEYPAGGEVCRRASDAA